MNMAQILIANYCEGIWNNTLCNVKNLESFEKQAKLIRTFQELKDLAGGDVDWYPDTDIEYVCDKASSNGVPLYLFATDSGSVGYCRYDFDPTGCFTLSANHYAIMCLNGELRVGDNVMNIPLDDDPIMHGVVHAIYPAGSPDALLESYNNCDVVHVGFTAEHLPESHIIALDDSIESPDVLLRINDISERQHIMLDHSQAAAQTVAFAVLKEYAQALKDNIVLNINNGGEQRICQKAPDGNIQFTRSFPGDDGRMVVESNQSISPGDMVQLLNHYMNCKEKGLPIVMPNYGFWDKCGDILNDYWKELNDSLDYVCLDDEIESIMGKMAQIRQLSSAASSFKEYARFMLVTVTEREIETAVFNTHKAAYARMEKELDETMPYGRESYGYEYGIDSNSAWSNANHNANCDWLIVEL